MYHRIEKPTAENLSKLAGSDYSLAKKLRIRGTGSSKLIHLGGIDFIENFNTTSQSNYLIAFELRPESLIGRLYGDQKKTFLIKKDDIVQIQFETFNLKILTKTGIVIRHEAIIEFISNDLNLKFYSPRSTYSSIKNFFTKEWLNEKTAFSVSTKELEVNYNAIIFQVLSKLLE